MQGSEAKKNPGTGGPHRAVFLDHIDLTSKLKIKTIIVMLSGNSEHFVSRKIERCRVQRPKKKPGTGGPHRAVFLDHIDLTSKPKIKTIIVLLSGNSERFVSRKIERCRVQRPKKTLVRGDPTVPCSSTT